MRRISAIDNGRYEHNYVDRSRYDRGTTAFKLGPCARSELTKSPPSGYRWGVQDPLGAGGGRGDESAVRGLLLVDVRGRRRAVAAGGAAVPAARAGPGVQRQRAGDDGAGGRESGLGR